MRICDHCKKEIDGGFRVQAIEEKAPNTGGCWLAHEDNTPREDFCSWICLYSSLKKMAEQYGWKVKE